MSATNEKILWDAEFNPAVKYYWLISGGLVFALSVIGIPLVPFWFLLGSAVTERYLKSMSCVLTTRSLKFSKGIFVRVEKTVPLDRITDLGLTQGPIMRALNIEALRVETAGQSTPGSLIQLAGIRDGRAFRDAVLRQRDLVVGSEEERLQQRAVPAMTSDHDAQLKVLSEMRDCLLRIEQRLTERSPDPHL